MPSLQILPQERNLGQELGSSLTSTLLPLMQQQFQRKQLQGALGKAQEAFKNENANPTDKAFSFINAIAGIPGSEKYAAPMLQMLLSQERTQNLYGKEGYGAEERGGKPPAPPAVAAKEAAKFSEGEEPAGFLRPPMNQDQVEKYAERYAQQLGTPDAYEQGLAQAQNINAAREKNRTEIANAGRAIHVSEQDIPRYTQVATQFQHEKDPAKLIRQTNNKWNEIQNNKKSLENATVPGIGRTVTQGLFQGGLINALMHPNANRQKFLKKYDDLVGKLVNEGEEPFVRKTLTDLGLSPTEVEERIHPLTDQVQNSLHSLPSGNKLNPQTREKELVKFLKANVDNNTSLLVLRDRLWKDKKYNWEEIGNAVKQAFPNTQNLTNYQASEIPELSNPPRQSLIDIFKEGGRPLEYFKGAK